MATSGSVVEQIRIGKERHAFVYQRVPRDVMRVRNDDVLELWIGKRGCEEGKKLVLVKYANGEVIAWDMEVQVLFEDGMDHDGEPVQGVSCGWTNARWYRNGQKIWKFKPGEFRTEDPLTPGKYQWSDPWGGKGWYETTVVWPQGRDEAKRRRRERECIVVPQDVLFTEDDPLAFFIFWS